ncbi:MAG: hypothetical protein J5527_09910 [Treponema sp.]|nr:hypothetical protein [Treponema sp.]
MKKIHPRDASAIFTLSYCFIGLLISIFFKKNIFGNEVYIIIGVISVLIVHTIFEKDYYDKK